MATNRTFKGAIKPMGKSGHFHEPQRHAMQAKGLKTGHLTPPVGSPVKSLSLFGNFGRAGKRLEGFSDPSEKMSWVRWDDGEVSGEFTKDLVSPDTFKKVEENINAPRESFEIYKIVKRGSFYGGKEVEIPSSKNPESELKEKYPGYKYLHVGTMTRAK